MPSRQERLKAERDAAKRAPAQAGVAGAAGAAAALAHVNLNPRDPGGDWTTQAEHSTVSALGAEISKQRAAAGDRGQGAMGRRLVNEAGGVRAS